jgi:hypothetical protein
MIFWSQLLYMFDKQWEHLCTYFFSIPYCKKPSPNFIKHQFHMKITKERGN